MKSQHKVTGTAKSIPAGITISIMVSVITTIIGAAITAWLVAGENLAHQMIGYAAILILLAASIFGGVTASRSIKHLKAQVIAAHGLLYYLILLMLTAIIMKGELTGVGITGIIILIGTGTAYLLSGLKKNKYKTRKLGV